MKKTKAQNIIKKIPDIFKFAKENFDKHGEEVLGEASGAVATIVKLFGKDLIDKYFEKVKDQKLEGFGFQNYLKAAFVQAEKSLAVIEKKLKVKLSAQELIEIIKEDLDKQKNEFDTSNLILIFRPIKHPAIVFVRESNEKFLRILGAKEDTINEFLKDFNTNIVKKIEAEFGEDYEDHLKDVEDNWLQENEIDFLVEMSELGRIGFTEAEDLKYETTYAEWEQVENFRKIESEGEDNDEKKIRPIQELINEYFDEKEESFLQKILFAVSDFGKGKSVFQRHFAAELAKNYLQTGDGLFPIYFNLKNFAEFSYESKLGVISDYLETKHRIKIDSDYFKKKDYIFLIDSLDECGELTGRRIDEVIESVKQIQNLDRINCRKNRIIITSRPIDEGLRKHLKEHEPLVRKTEGDIKIPYFISIYGFKKEQFNDWLIDSLKKQDNLAEVKATGFAKSIIEQIASNKKIDVYEELVKNKILSKSELRRPIFAYMIYQLIIKNVDFAAIGKIGIYLSFLNLLSKEAKYIKNPDYKVNLQEEFRCRNVLHATAALWMYQRQRGKPGELKKVDICRTIEGRKSEEKEQDILDRFDKVRDLQFLSHSYFGEDGNTLHFQHQSFAEILLAEYYLKIFLKFALDEDSDVEEARVKLILGEPTEQTMQFFQELLTLIKESAKDELNDEEVIEKRKLLFPLMASLATKEYNKDLFCGHIYYKWYEQVKIAENQTEYPPQSLQNWVISQDVIDKIIRLAKEIIESKTNYLLSQAKPKSSLYDDEVLSIQKELNDLPPDIDRWLALLVGNTLYNNEKGKKFFAGQIDDSDDLFRLIINWNYSSVRASPYWGKNLFIGIDMSKKETTTDLSYKNLSSIDFSNSYFKNTVAFFSCWRFCSFNNVSFEGFIIPNSALQRSTFDNIKIVGGAFSLENCTIENGVFFPPRMGDYIRIFSVGQFNMGSESAIIGFSSDGSYYKRLIDDIFKTLKGIFVYALEIGLTTHHLKSCFQFDDEEVKKYFFKKIDELKKSGSKNT